MNEAQLSNAQSQYEKDVMGCDPMTAGDPTGEVDVPETIDPHQFNNDCPDLCLPADMEGTTKLMAECKKALESLETLRGKPDFYDLNYGISTAFYAQRIGQIVLETMLAQDIDADMLEVE